MPITFRIPSRCHGVVTLKSALLLGLCLLVFGNVMLVLRMPYLEEVQNNDDAKQTAFANDIVAEISNNNHVDKHSKSRVSPGAWQVMPADATMNDVELNPTTYICACAKCGTTSMYEELFAIVHGRSFASMNYTGPPWIHTLTNEKLWTNIQAREMQYWPEHDEFQKHGSFALIRDPKKRIISAWKSKVKCIDKEIADHKRLVPELLDLAGPMDNITLRTDLGFPCLNLSDYLLVLSQIHKQGDEGSLDEHFLPQHLGCFVDIPPLMWTVVTTIDNPGALCSLKSVLFKDFSNKSPDDSNDDGCRMMKIHGRKVGFTLTSEDEVILDRITRKEYEMLREYLPGANATKATAS